VSVFILNALYGTLQSFGKDQKMELHQYCLAHLFTYKQFVEDGSNIYGLAWIGKPGFNSGICARSSDKSPGWPKTGPVWALITWRRWPVERRVICQKFQNVI